MAERAATRRLVLLRHGQSVWNREGRFTGWVDVDLSELGVAEARRAGEQLRDLTIELDTVHTSLLKRAIRTTWIALDAMDRMWLPVAKSWRLNERHYGGLQGLSKEETAERLGEEQVFVWRRSYDVPPPDLAEEEVRRFAADPRYADLSPAEMPRAESLKDTTARALPYWERTIAPELRSGKRVLVSAHGNSLRALAKHLESISDADIPNLEIPTGAPLVYELDADLRPVTKYYARDALGEEAVPAQAASERRR